MVPSLCEEPKDPGDRHETYTDASGYRNKNYNISNRDCVIHRYLRPYLQACFIASRCACTLDCCFCPMNDAIMF